jgi:hypothetical protein
MTATTTPPIPGQTHTIEQKKESAFPFHGIPGQPHPDVAIARNVLREIQPGELLSYEKAAAAIQLSSGDPVFRRRFDRARRQLERDRIVIVCIPGQGFMRELAGQTKERVSGRETRTLQRKAARNVRQLGSIDVAQVATEQRPELFALMVINRAVVVATGKSARAKLTAASVAISAELTVTKALEVLRDREKDGDQ